MRGLLVALLFAGFLIIATNIPTDDADHLVDAQTIPGVTKSVVLAKIVAGVPPDSSWEFDYAVGTNTFYLTLPSNGHTETTIIILLDSIRITERVKNGYIPYVRTASNTIALQQQSFIQTNIATIGPYPIDEALYIEFSNQYSPSHPPPSYSGRVGGTIYAVDKLIVLGPYLAVIGLIAITTTTVLIIKRRQKN